MNYNGYRNWTVWNINLWTMNDEDTYRNMPAVIFYQGKQQSGLLYAYLKDKFGKSTPDGAQLRHFNQQDCDELAESLKYDGSVNHD